MSLTVISLIVAVISLVLAIGFAFMADEYAICFFLAALFFGLSAAGLISSIAYYNSNARDTAEREKIACMEEGKEVLRYSATDYCVEPGSKIIRIL